MQRDPLGKGLVDPLADPHFEARPTPPHPTPAHYPNPLRFQPDHGTGSRGWQATEAQRSIDPLTALAATIGLLRPDWRHDAIRAALVRTSGSWREVARRALHVALDPDQRTPLGIENADMRPYDATPLPPTPDELRNAGRCEHGAVVRTVAGRPACPLCRTGAAS